MRTKRLRAYYQKNGFDKRNYEVLVILNQKLSEQALKEKFEKFSEIIKELGGSVVEIAQTKIRSFAYFLNERNNLRGYYACIYVKLDPLKMIDLKRKFSLEEDILRIIIRLANPKKKSYGVFSAKYDEDGGTRANKNEFISFEDPNNLLKFLDESGQIIKLSTTSGKCSKKIHKGVSKEIKTSRIAAFLSHTQGVEYN